MATVEAAEKRARVERPRITFVTGNKNKLLEVQKILGSDAPFELVNENVDLPELQGEPEDVAREKCRLAFKEVCGATVANLGVHLPHFT